MKPSNKIVIEGGKVTLIKVAAVISAAFLNISCFAQTDKCLHIGYGSIIGSSTYFMSNSIKNVSNIGAIIVSASAVTFAAAGKEMIDGKPDIKDFFATELGGAVGIVVTHYATRKYFDKLAFYFDTQHISGKRYNYLGIVKRF